MPRGVHRFRTFEESEQWSMRMMPWRSGAACQGTPCASTSVSGCSRPRSGRRRVTASYCEEDVERVQFVRRAQAMGLSLGDIRELLGARLLRSPKQCWRVGVRLKARIEAVERQIVQLQAFREELAENLKRCRHAESEAKCCPVVLDLTGKSGGIALRK